MAGISDVFAIDNFCRKGIQAEQAKPFTDAGIKNSHEVIFYIQNNMQANQVKAFKDIGIQYVFHILEFLKKGIVAEEVKAFKEAGIWDSYSDVMFYIKNNIHPKQVKELKDIGIDDKNEVAKRLGRFEGQQHAILRQIQESAHSNEQRNVNSEQNQQISLPNYGKCQRSDAQMKKVSEAGRQIFQSYFRSVESSQQSNSHGQRISL